MSTEQEGVIKFRFEMAERSPVFSPLLAELGAWRTVLRRLGVLGQDPGRYGGYGFGNVSVRLAGAPGFFISGSQTGGREELGPEQWVEVLESDGERSFLRARGLADPSAESLTHAAVYAAQARATCVLHGHSPEIFAAAGRLGLPATAAEVPYGTPAMAREVARLLAATGVARSGFFVMGGHQDGVVAFGRGPAEAGRRLVAALARALALPPVIPASALS